ncbi:MAG TPA: hypothetical protein H9964_01265, partial [Candidatus Gallimonas intestinavium]|nr:hypothetical protein [Candidatus Gallimonas intestinavium]
MKTGENWQKFSQYFSPISAQKGPILTHFHRFFTLLSNEGGHKDSERAQQPLRLAFGKPPP